MIGILRYIFNAVLRQFLFNQINRIHFINLINLFTTQLLTMSTRDILRVLIDLISDRITNHFL